LRGNEPDAKQQYSLIILNTHFRTVVKDILAQTQGFSRKILCSKSLLSQKRYSKILELDSTRKNIRKKLDELEKE
jgi:hypothetical protein